MEWHARLRHWFKQGPYTLSRRPVPTPGSTNLINLTWAIPHQSAINGAIPNHRTFMFQEPTVVPNHLVGLTSIGGYDVAYPYQSTPLTQVQPVSGGPAITIYG